MFIIALCSLALIHIESNEWSLYPYTPVYLKRKNLNE